MGFEEDEGEPLQAGLAVSALFCHFSAPGFFGSGFILDSPNPQQLAASGLEIAAEIHELKFRERPRQVRMLTVLKEKGDDSLVVTRLIQRKQEFVFHLPRANRIRGQNDDEPITPGQNAADFIMPLSRACYVCGAVPIANAVPF